MSKEPAAEAASSLYSELFNPNSGDPLVAERGKCFQKDCHVKKFYKELETCTNRVNSKENTAETCHQEIVDLVEALAHCVHDKAFKKLV